MLPASLFVEVLYPLRTFGTAFLFLDDIPPPLIKLTEMMRCGLRGCDSCKVLDTEFNWGWLPERCMAESLRGYVTIF